MIKSKAFKIFFAISALAILLSSVSLTALALTSTELYAQAATIEQAVADLERQAALMQASNPVGAQALRAQAAALKQQAVDLKKQADYNKSQELSLQADVYDIEAELMQASNPVGAQALRAQAAALRQQSIALYEQSQLGRPIETIYGNPGESAPGPAPAYGPEAPPQQYDKNYTLIVPIPGYDPGANADPLGYIKGIYNFGIGFGMLIAVAIIVFAGLKWTTSAGNVSAQSEAKDMILNAVFGVVMLLGAVLILRTIDPKLTKLTLPNLKLPKSDFDFGEHNNYVKKMEELNKQSYDNNRKVEETLAKVTAAQNEYNKNPTKENLIKLKKEAIAWNTALVSKYQTDLATFETMKNESKRQLDAIKAAGALDEAGIKDWIARVGVPLYGIIATKNDISDYNNAVAKAESAYARAYQRVVETKAQLSGAQTTLAALQQELAGLEKP